MNRKKPKPEWTMLELQTEMLEILEEALEVLKEIRHGTNHLVN